MDQRQKRALGVAALVLSSLIVSACGSDGNTYAGSGGSGGSMAAGGTPSSSGGASSGGASSGGASSGGADATGGSTGGTPPTSGGSSAGGTAGASGSAGSSGSGGALAGGSGGGGSGGSSGAGGIPGTLLFMDNFEDDDDNGWTNSYPGGFTVVFTTSYIYRSNSGPGQDIWTIAGSGWTDMRIDVDFVVVGAGVGPTHVGLAGRVQDLDNAYRFECYGGNVSLAKVVGGVVTSLDTSQIVAIPTTIPATLTLVIQGSTLTGYVNDEPRVSATDFDFTSGGIALTSMDGFVDFDNVSVTLP